mmetsp:Transcript_36453/g.101185  ORF Transcript_36453/g.101185 Transcript_36453/m.101185 type:complete len:266 (+) Transcript_36453:162-959(+)
MRCLRIICGRRWCIHRRGRWCVRRRCSGQRGCNRCRRRSVGTHGGLHRRRRSVRGRLGGDRRGGAVDCGGRGLLRHLHLLRRRLRLLGYHDLLSCHLLRCSRLVLLEPLYLLIVLHCHLVVLLCKLVFLHLQFFMRLALVVLQDQSVCLMLKRGLLLLRRVLQHEQLFVVLLGKQHLLLLDLLIHLQLVLPFLLVTQCKQILGLLLQLLCQDLGAMPQLIIQALGIGSFLPVNRYWVWKASRQTGRRLGRLSCTDGRGDTHGRDG